jgi:hypothetical protein
MNEEQLNSRLNLLDQVERVEVSPFLKTRIDQEILNQSSGKIQGKWALSLFASFAIVLFVNVVAIKSAQTSTDSELSISDYGFQESTDIYMY